MALETAQAVLDSEQWEAAEWEALAALPGETARAHTAFLDYVRLGAGRSLRKLCDRYQTGTGSGPESPTKRLSTLKEWSAKYAWQDRLAEFKKERDQREQQAWEDRRRALREADWQTGEELRQLVARILAETPQFLSSKRRVVKGAEGQPDREIITVGISIDAMLKAADLASKLQTAAAGVTPPAQQVTLGGTLTVEGTSVLDEVTPAMAQAAQAALRAALEAQQKTKDESADETADGDSDPAGGAGGDDSSEHGDPSDGQ